MVRTILPKICFALITNKEKKRYEYIRPLLNQLKGKLSKDFNIEIFESWKQPKVVPHPLSLIIRKRYHRWKTFREWARYRKIKPRSLFLDLLVLARRLLLAILNKEVECRWSAIDSYVTDKHIRAWARFLETEGDFLICFEDDVMFKSDSVSRLKLLLKKISNYSQKPIYIDLAGGCNLDILKVGNLESKRNGGFIYFKRPVTNTACCYIINRISAELFLFNLLKKPELRLVSIDPLLNELFVISKEKRYFCCHANPTIFLHGSLAGNYPTLMQAP